ncbi:MAG: hypothetical protein EHM79_01205 [Geobacter sp.]|nr:MAG: hypothetical protein EHM79_01205 [Geobacter sp.]
MNRTVWIIFGIVALLLVAGGSFYGGTLYGQNQAQTVLAARRQGAFPGAGENGQFNGQPGANARAGAQGGMLFGQIAEIGDGMLTVTDNNGKQTQVKVTDTTLIEKQASVELTDLTQGETVMISGSQGTDGTITARSVQVAPMGRFGPGGPGAAGTPVTP